MYSLFGTSAVGLDRIGIGCISRLIETALDACLVMGEAGVLCRLNLLANGIILVAVLRSLSLTVLSSLVLLGVLGFFLECLRLRLK
ncbi:hypothetical protein K458DRAFT_62350 [Lentithecium fluviatile CBS 122367]|uniref:Uncharacterized protein n=1 Tax=Lentithecium fluviatile CBS 122367 TaxID=1168545 RepID=A0A6G1JKR8_9PLEO|nr:hypothetical protein K458DRAFT_62350 [Lentithecium fluviatile CBS 122367]